MSCTRLEVFNEQTAPVFTIEVDGARLGELRVSRGGIRWLPTRYGEDPYILNWQQFDSIMREQRRG